MIFAHADHSIALAIYHAVGVSHIDIRCDRLRLADGVEAIQALVCEVREIDRAAADRKTAAAVFMDACAGIERNRRDVNRSSVRRKLYIYVTPFFLRPGLYPVDVFAIHRDLPQAYRARNDQIGSDRGFP